MTSILSSEVEVEEAEPLPPSEPALVTPSSILSGEVTVSIEEKKPSRPWWILAILAAVGIIVLTGRRRREEEES
jgi:hypothetical protein